MHSINVESVTWLVASLPDSHQTFLEPKVHQSIYLQLRTRMIQPQTFLYIFTVEVFKVYIRLFPFLLYLVFMVFILKIINGFATPSS